MEIGILFVLLGGRGVKPAFAYWKFYLEFPVIDFSEEA
jgi:hypothetical protein